MAEMNYASRGVANAGLTTGIIGATLGALNSGLGGILGGWGNACGNADNMPINRYEATQQARIAELETEVKLRDANFYTASEMNKLRDYVDGKFASMEKEICDQKVYNAANTATVGCIANQVNQLFALTKLVIPNSSICPGWTTTATTATAPTAG